jgi:hypothetical protein
MASLSTTYEQRQEWRAAHLAAKDKFVTKMPKVELHVHIEGTMTPELRWKLSQRNHTPLTCGSQRVPLTTLDQVRDAYTRIRGRIGAASADAEKHFTFFEIYYGGFELLQTEEDFYDLAMGYFERAVVLGHSKRWSKGLSILLIYSGDYSPDTRGSSCLVLVLVPNIPPLREKVTTPIVQPQP